MILQVSESRNSLSETKFISVVTDDSPLRDRTHYRHSSNQSPEMVVLFVMKFVLLLCEQSVIGTHNRQEPSSLALSGSAGRMIGMGRWHVGDKGIDIPRIFRLADNT